MLPILHPSHKLEGYCVINLATFRLMEKKMAFHKEKSSLPEKPLVVEESSYLAEKFAGLW